MRRLAIAVGCTILAVACTTSKPVDPPVKTDFDRDRDFSTLHTFRFATPLPTIDESGGAPRMERRLGEAIEAELEARGFERANGVQTDFRVRSSLSFSTGSTPQPLPGASQTQPRPADYSKTAAIQVEVLDPFTSDVIWKGTVSGFSLGIFDSQQDLRRLVRTLLAEFPPITGR